LGRANPPISKSAFDQKQSLDVLSAAPRRNEMKAIVVIVLDYAAASRWSFDCGTCGAWAARVAGLGCPHLVLLSRPTGSITSGSLMGISVGEDADAAITRLRHLGFKALMYFPGGGDLYSGGVMFMHPGDRRSAVTILPSQTVIALKDSGWRYGAVELIEDRGGVVRITWGYGGPLAAFAI
jgi:hypothetical protein